jgi:hypothetical protein
MRESNKKQLNVLFGVLICVFVAIAAAVSLAGIAPASASSSAIVVGDGSEEQNGIPSSAIVIGDGSEGESVSGASDTLVLPQGASVTIKYGQELPKEIRCGSASNPGATITAQITWPADLLNASTSDRRPTAVGAAGIKTVTLTSSGYENSTAQLRLIIEKANFNAPANWDLDFIYGETLPTSVDGWVNENITDVTDPTIIEQFTVWGTVKWDHAPTITVEEAGTSGITLSYVVSPSGGKAYTDSYNLNQSKTAKVTVQPLVLANGILNKATTATLTYVYSTKFSVVSAAVQSFLRAEMAGNAAIPQSVAAIIASNLKVKPDGSEYGANSLLNVKLDGGNIVPYSATVEITTPSVVFADGAKIIPNLTVDIIIEKLTLGTAQVKTVHHGVYDGTPQPATFDFAINKFTGDEVGLTAGYTVAYFQNNKPIETLAPVKVGLYQAVIRINDANYATPEQGLQVDYYVTKNPNPASFLSQATYEGETASQIYSAIGVVQVDFKFAGHIPAPAFPDTDAFKAHGFNVTYTIADAATGLTVAEILNVGQYLVRFKFTSPNVEDYTVELIYEVVYEDDNASENGLNVVLKKLFTTAQVNEEKLILEYSGKEYTVLDFTASEKAYLDRYNISVNIVLAYPDKPIKEIGEYVATFEIQSLNHINMLPKTMTVEIVKKTVVISDAQIPYRFDAIYKKPIPSVSTGLAGISASAYIVSITNANGKEEDTKLGVVNAGTYTFTYALNANEYVKTATPTVDVKVVINKASKAELEALIRKYVVFNNKERIDATSTFFAPQVLSGITELEKYGISLPNDPAPFNPSENDYVNVDFVFVTANYDVDIDGEFTYRLRYDVAEEENAWIILVVVGGLVALVAAAYVLSFVGKRKPLAAGVRPTDRTPTIYNKPTYKPDSPGPKPVKEKKEKPVKEPKEKAPKPAAKPAAPAAAPQQPAKKPAAKPQEKGALDLMSNMKMGNSREIGKFSDTKVFKDRK